MNRRAHTGPVNLEALPVLGVLQLPGLQPEDALPPSVTRLLLAGWKQQSVRLEPIHHLTRLDTLELQLCFAKRGQLAQLRDKIPSLQALYLSMGVAPGHSKGLAFPKLHVETWSLIR